MLDKNKALLCEHVIELIITISERLIEIAAREERYTIPLVAQNVRKILELANRGFVLQTGRLTFLG